MGHNLFELPTLCAGFGAGAAVSLVGSRYLGLPKMVGLIGVVPFGILGAILAIRLIYGVWPKFK